MAKSNNVLLALTVVLLLVSLFGTFALMNSITFKTPPAGPSPGIQQGEIKLGILPEPSYDSTTGYIGLEIE